MAKNAVATNNLVEKKVILNHFFFVHNIIHWFAIYGWSEKQKKRTMKRTIFQVNDISCCTIHSILSFNESTKGDQLEKNIEQPLHILKRRTH